MSTSPPEITASFQENGYYLAKGVYSPAEIAELERLRPHRRATHRQRRGGRGPLAGRGDRQDRAKGHGLRPHAQRADLFRRLAARLPAAPVSRNQPGDPQQPRCHSPSQQALPKAGGEGRAVPHAPGLELFPHGQRQHDGGHHPCLQRDGRNGLPARLSRLAPASAARRKATARPTTEDNCLKDYPIEKVDRRRSRTGRCGLLPLLHAARLNAESLAKGAQNRPGPDAQRRRQVEDDNRHPNARLVLSGWNHHAKRSLANVS